MAYFEVPQPAEPIEVIERVPRGQRAVRWRCEIQYAASGLEPAHVVLQPCGKRTYELISLSTWPVDGVGFEAFSHDPREGEGA